MAITRVLFLGGMLTAIRSHLAYRAAVRAEAQMLIDLYGGESWQISRERAFLAMREGTDPDRAWHVNGVIERRLKIDHQPDTATRYLEGAKAKGQHPFLW